MDATKKHHKTPLSLKPCGFYLASIIILQSCIAGKLTENKRGPAQKLVDNSSDICKETNSCPKPIPTSNCPAESAFPSTAIKLLSHDGNSLDRPAASHGDLNINLRGWQKSDLPVDLYFINGHVDKGAPRVYSVFNQDRPRIINTYLVNDWNWSCQENGCRGGPTAIRDGAASIVGFAVQPGEPIRTPSGLREIGEGMVARIIYADSSTLTLSFTRRDDIVVGYAMHFMEICVHPSLLEAYNKANTGLQRNALPAVKVGQVLGIAMGTEALIAIRDSGTFMDPRAKNHWWQDFAD